MNSQEASDLSTSANDQLDDLAHLEEQAASYPNSAEHLHNLADAYADLGLWKKAAEAYQRAIVLEPFSADLYNSLGTVYEEMALTDKSQQAYQQAIELAPEDPMAYYNLGSLLEDQQDISQAIQLYEKCLQCSTDRYERSEVKKRLVRLTSETPTGQTRLAYRIAASLLVIGILNNCIGIVASMGAWPISNVVIDIVLAFGLFAVRPGIRNLTIFRAIGGIILGPIFYAMTGADVQTIAVETLVQWSYCGALILILTGRTKPWRITLFIAMAAIFTIITVRAYVLLFLFALS